MWDSGIRVGEALGLRHEDIVAAERQITICPRVNDNRARAKSGRSRTIPVSGASVRLYGDYLHGEYGDLDSDHVFVNRWGGPVGRAWSYPAVYDLVVRLRARTGIEFDPALDKARLRDPGFAGWGADRGGLQTPRSRLDHHYRCGLRSVSYTHLT